MSEAPATQSASSTDALEEILRAQDWKALRARLVRLAFSKRRSRALAEELADAVIVACCDPANEPWNPSEQPDLMLHAIGVMRNHLSRERRRRNVRNDPRNVATVREIAPRGATPAQMLDDAQRAARNERVLAGARARMSNPLDRQVFDLALDGIDKTAEQAAHVGRPIQEIRRARERIQYALRAAMHDEVIS